MSSPRKTYDFLKKNPRQLFCDDCLEKGTGVDRHEINSPVSPRVCSYFDAVLETMQAIGTKNPRWPHNIQTEEPSQRVQKPSGLRVHKATQPASQ
jgi:hypothetical protein